LKLGKGVSAAGFQALESLGGRVLEVEKRVWWWGGWVLESRVWKNREGLGL
jgi:hypothetical protein